MKKIQLILPMLMLLFTVACSDNSNDDDTSNITQTQLQTTVSGKTWVITSYVDDGNNQTSNFSGYDFTFNSDGSASATNGTTTVNGTWSYGSDNSTPKFILYFGMSSPFDELDEDWKIVSLTTSKISLDNISGGDGSLSTLVFELK